jgi:hypothetical protein
VQITAPPVISNLSPTSGTIGATITITGSNFGSSQGGSNVRLNGTLATATSWTATSIATTVPAGATTGFVTVTVGAQTSNGITFTVTTATQTFTAATCNRTDVNAVINGPTHVAANGDVIQIPAGSCTWTSAIAVPANIGISIKGSGTPNASAATQGTSASCAGGTTLTGTQFFTMTPGPTAALSRISCMKFLPAGPGPTITARGTCSAGGCPNLRLDNLTMDGSWTNTAWSDGSLVIIANMFGVADHNTIGAGTCCGPGNYLDFINIGHGKWQGVGGWGDSSWATVDSFGTNQQFYVENNVMANSIETDSDDTNIAHGGGRATCRFNTGELHAFGVCTGHGTDTTFGTRGIRQVETYYNTLQCKNTQTGCGSLSAGRSSVGMSFSNVITNATGAFFKGVANFDAQRVWRGNNPFGFCNGTNVWDVNSGGVALICLDQSNRGKGLLVQRAPDGSAPVLVSTGNPGSVAQALDPSYEADTNGPSTMDHTLGPGGPSPENLQFANRDYFAEALHQAAQTSATSPFNGSSGTGHGTLAFRPTSCTLNGDPTGGGVGYWAKDQGTWNQGGAGGVLYVCRDAAHKLDVNGNAAVCTQAQDTNHFWCAYYTPYTYPHPLTLVP